MTEGSSPVPRRNFLQIAGIVSLGAVAGACTPEVVNQLATLTPQKGPLGTQTPEATDTTTPEATSTPKWELSLHQKVEVLKDPALFTEFQGRNTRKIVTDETDKNEYKKLSKKVFINNMCGPAILATANKLLGYLSSGSVPDVTISDIYNALDGKSFTDNKGYSAKFFDWDDEMYFSGLPDAIRLLMPGLVSKAEFITPDYGARYTRVLPQADWPNAMSKAEAVCKAGGFIIIGCMKHGSGHILLATDVKKDGSALVVDTFFGTAKKVMLKTFIDEVIDPDAKFLGKQPGLFNMIGITPR